MTTSQTSQNTRRRLIGTVVSAKMAKTIVVRIDRQVSHPLYGKQYTASTKVKAHDETGAAHVGDVVQLEETRPISKDKHWRYRATIKAAVNQSV